MLYGSLWRKARTTVLAVCVVGLLLILPLLRPQSTESAASVSAVEQTFPEKARKALHDLPESDQIAYLDNRARLQIAAGDFAAAVVSLDLLFGADPGSMERMMPYRLFAEAKAAGGPFEEAFRASFEKHFAQLDDLTSLRRQYWFVADMSSAEAEFRRVFSRYKPEAEVPLADTLALGKQYAFLAVFRAITPLVPRLMDEDDRRRYSIQDDVLIRTADGASVSAVVVRPLKRQSRIATALDFTIYATASIPSNAKNAAAHGFAGVVGFTRGKRNSPDAVVPYEHDGDDAREVIGWIVKQPWSDGQVGMFGGSYDGFTQWAAAKHLPPALKTIAPAVAAIPGLGLPMENNVFLNANYGWAAYVTNNKYLDNAAYNDPQLGSLNSAWFRSGKSYRTIDEVRGGPNKWLQRWLEHPAFDRYWQAMVPYGDDFARINIPVLTITGYFDDGQGSALQYLREHYKHNPKPEHYLVIGPWDHFGAQASFKPAMLRGYSVDPVSQVDAQELAFQWLSYVMRGGKKPDLLVDKINYQQMGSNVWRHASSLEATHSETLTFYLTDEKDDDFYRLATTKPSKVAFLDQTVDFSDRSTVNNSDYYPSPIIRRPAVPGNGFAFLSAPFEAPASVDGMIGGELLAKVNKRDFDFGLVFYEIKPDGEWFHLSYYIGRASFANDMTKRRLLVPGSVEAIPFERTRMTSRRLEKGSRLLVLLNVNKNRTAQLNYGTGMDVSDESIIDAGAPMRVQWRNDSSVRVPISR